MNLDAIRGLSQPDQRSCGPTSLVAARILVDPSYVPSSFSTDVLVLHRQLTALTFGGRAQLPWPRALGTPPWAVARAMASYTGLPYRTRIVRFGRRASTCSAIAAAVTAGLPAPFYVGSTWLPRHVVLVVGPAQGGLLVYNPGHGGLDEMSAADFVAGKLTTFGRWTRPWFAVLPRGG